MTEVFPLLLNQELTQTTDVLQKPIQFSKSNSYVLESALPALELSLKKPLIDSRDVNEIIYSRIKTLKSFDVESSEDPFYVADLGEVVRQHKQWIDLLPRIESFYAIKCNPDPLVIKTLMNLGTHFDCASKGEIQMVLDQGGDCSNIIYANPCKQISHLRYANSVGVSMVTFDNVDELYKIKTFMPHAKAILRILTDDSKSLCKLGTKFGASQQMVPLLLKTALDLDLNLVGVSFHVGSGCFDAQAFGDAVILAKKVFDLAKEYGFELSVLDVGGGFPGQNSDGVQFKDIANVLNYTLDIHFPVESKIRIIAEPGRYFVSSAYTLIVNVVARRVVESSENKYMYYINDGMYGSFNCLTFDHAKVLAKPLMVNDHYYYQKNGNDKILSEHECSIWGPTCDSIDCIGKKCLLPVMNVGDFMYFENMGAYTMCAASCFNGFKKSIVLYTNTQ